MKRAIGRLSAVLAVVCALWPSGAQAFKTATHAASANLALSQLGAAITLDTSPNTLVFEVDGKRLDLGIDKKEGYQAVLNFPEFFRAGVIGPDGFPDLISGQTWAHGNEAPSVQGAVKKAAGPRQELYPELHQTMVPYEGRPGPSEFRAIDYAMALLDFFKTFDFKGDAVQRGQALAFVLGYVCHGVGDGFAHTWVNEISGGAWDFGLGGGMFGPFTEEIRHVSVETLVDAHVPLALLNSPGDTTNQRGQLHLLAPASFLDKFYAARTPFARGDKTRGSTLQSFKDYYQNIDQFNGGFTYSYFNAQADVANFLVDASHLGPFFEFAKNHQESKPISTFLDVVSLPGKLVSEVTSSLGIPEINILKTVTGGYIDCYNSIGGSLGGENSDLERLREI